MLNKKSAKMFILWPTTVSPYQNHNHAVESRYFAIAFFVKAQPVDRLRLSVCIGI